MLVPTHAYAATTGMFAALYAAGTFFGVGLTLFVVLHGAPPAQVARW